MSEKEIQELAVTFGLDLAKLIIHEPVYRKHFDRPFKEFCLEYRDGNMLHDWNFIIPVEYVNTDFEEEFVRFKVRHGLIVLAEKLIEK